MIDTDVFGYRQENNGTYTVTKNNDRFLCGICDSVEAAKIVELLLTDEREDEK